MRYDDVRSLSRDPQTFRSGEGVQFADAPPEALEASQSFLAMDAPRHTKLRGLVQAAFTPRQVARIEEGIRANARRIVDEAAPLGGGDFVELIAKRLPLITISDMIGVPDADRERVVEAADLLVTLADPEVLAGRVPVQVLGEALGTLHQFATELAAYREKNPGDDLMTALVEAEVDGERLTHAEIAAFFVLLSVAGNDTTRHTTSHGMRALTLYPDQRALLIEDLDARMPAAVEEFVRWATPVMTFRRTTTRPVELHGQPIGAGDIQRPARLQLHHVERHRLQPGTRLHQRQFVGQAGQARGQRHQVIGQLVRRSRGQGRDQAAHRITHSRGGMHID